MAERLSRMQTGVLGGVDPPSIDELALMQRGAYVLRAHGGQITRVPAEKTRLPRDPNGHPQGANVAMAPDGSVYVAQSRSVCKSTDGGRTWSAYDHQGTDVDHFNRGCGCALTILGDGTFITVAGGGKEPGALVVLHSHDEGRTWQELSTIEIDAQYHSRSVYAMCRLDDASLLCPVQCTNVTYADEGNKRYAAGQARLLAYRSEDGGNTWPAPAEICLWSGEPGVARMASGKLLAVVRHQRVLLPDDPPDLIETTGAYRKDPTRPSNTSFWPNPRTTDTAGETTDSSPPCSGSATASPLR